MVIRKRAAVQDKAPLRHQASGAFSIYRDRSIAAADATFMAATRPRAMAKSGNGLRSRSQSECLLMRRDIDVVSTSVAAATLSGIAATVCASAHNSLLSLTNY
jgi:hypothetical protein